MKKFILYFMAVVYFLLTLSFCYGFITSLNDLPESPTTDVELAAFGFGLCFVPSFFLLAGFVPFYTELFKELKCINKKKDAADRENKE